MNVIEVENLTKRYGDIHALRGISFHVGAGEIFALLGPNGAGKSTTVRILATLTRPSGGRALVAGIDVLQNPERIRGQIGYLAQSSGLDLSATALDNLQLQGRIFGLSGGRLKARVAELLGLFDLKSEAARIVRTYSGGMKRRLDLALAMIQEPKVLFLDEPTVGLDPQSRLVVWDHVRRLSREMAVTILLTTHNLEEADILAHRLAIVDRGQIVITGTAQELKASLKGDHIAIQFNSVVQLSAGQAVLQGINGFSKIFADGTTLYIQVQEGTRALPAIVRAIENAGLPIEQASISFPSLDDVYLHATGHKYRVGVVSRFQKFY